MEGESSGKKTATFYGWKFRHYFVVVEGENNLRARCVLCPASKKPLSSARNTTSNFKKHLDTVHKTTRLVEIERDANTEDDSCTAKRKRSDAGEVEVVEPPMKRQCLLVSRSIIPPAKVKGLISEYVIEDMMPLSTVESPAFRKLISSFSSGEVSMPDRKSFTSHLDKIFASMEQMVKNILDTTTFVCTTADVWTAHNRSFFGMTVHWIDANTLQRCKAAIACERLVGRHTYDVLASRIESIHRSYNLIGKVTATVTDNGSNFVKAFKSFSVTDSTSTSTEVVQEDFSPEDSTDEQEATFEDIHDALMLDNIDDLTQVEYDLPAHERCAAHTMNLVVSSDITKSLSTSALSRTVYRSSFSKCTALWNKASRSTLASDDVEATLKRKLIVPTPTRWNSYYDAVVRVTENATAELDEICTKLNLRCFSEKELTFLKEYCKVLQPFARGLDILQGENKCFYGTLLPTLEAVLKKIRDIKTNLSSMTTGLAFSLEDSIKNRFENIFDSKAAILAAITLPKFKLRWVDTQSKKDSYKQMLIDEMRQFVEENRVAENEDAAVQTTASQDEGSQKRDHFYDFPSDDESTSTDSVEIEAANYLSTTDKDLDCLHRYPIIKSLFFKYNTTLPSSAPVERLFSLGNLVLTPKRNRLTDARFEKLLLMRYNKHLLHF